MEGRGVLREPRTEIKAHVAANPNLGHGMKRAASSLIENINFIKIQNDNDFAKIYQALFDMILGDVVSAKKAEVLLKCVAGYSAHRKSYLNTDFPQDVLNQMNKALDMRDDAIRKILSPEQWAQYQNLLGKEKDAEEPPVE